MGKVDPTRRSSGYTFPGIPAQHGSKERYEHMACYFPEHVLVKYAGVLLR